VHLPAKYRESTQFHKELTEVLPRPLRVKVTPPRDNRINATTPYHIANVVLSTMQQELARSRKRPGQLNRVTVRLLISDHRLISSSVHLACTRAPGGPPSDQSTSSTTSHLVRLLLQRLLVASLRDGSFSAYLPHVGDLAQSAPSTNALPLRITARLDRGIDCPIGLASLSFCGDYCLEKRPKRCEQNTTRDRTD
jgi:hypothetical protein